jgi:hypothetical protein
MLKDFFRFKAVKYIECKIKNRQQLNEEDFCIINKFNDKQRIYILNCIYNTINNKNIIVSNEEINVDDLL